jgi:hypothetical protein
VINPPSLVREYTWIWSKDPALDAPPADAPKKLKTEWDRKLKQARETGSYAAVLKPGETPTLVTLRSIPQDVWGAMWSAHHAGDIGVPSLPFVAVRLALRGLANTGIPDGDPEIKLVRDDKLPDRWADQLGPMADAEALNAFGPLVPGIATELWGHILERQTAPSPK